MVGYLVWNESDLCQISKYSSHLKRMNNYYIRFLEHDITSAISGSIRFSTNKGHKILNFVESVVSLAEQGWK